MAQEPILSPLQDWRTGGNAVIRQAISCDICGAEKKQTNNWFVAYEHSGELRVSGWNSRNRLRTGDKHLCGQTCLHKLVDEFMARIITGRLAASATEAQEPEDQVSAQVAATDTSLTSKAAYAEPKPVGVESKPVFEPKPAYVETKPAFVESRSAFREPEVAAVEPKPAFVEPLPGYEDFESSARLITAQEPVSISRTAPASAAVVVPMQPSSAAEDALSSLTESRSGYSPRHWRAEAWERERERELRAGERIAEVGRRHKGF
jgi:hypothetical protein